MDISDISKVANRKRLHVDAEKLREKVSRETAKIIKLKVAQDTAYWDLKEKLQQVEGNHERLQQNMVEVQMQHEAISGQYQDELRLRPETLNKLSSTREICDVLEEYSERLKETVSRCKADQGALCEAYQRSGAAARELQARHAAQALADKQLVLRLEEKVKLMSEHQSQMAQHWAAARAQASSEVAAAKQQAAQLQSALSDTKATLDSTRQDIAKKEESLLELQNEMTKMLQEFDRQADEMKSVLVKQDKDLKEASESNEILTKALANQEEFTKSVCEENNQLKDKLSALEDDQTIATNKIKDLDISIQSAIAERDKLKNDIEVLMKQKEELEVAAKNKDEHITELETEIQNAKQQMSSLEGEKQEISDELNRLKEECATKATRIEELEKIGEEQTKKVQGLEEELAKETSAAASAASASARLLAEKERELAEKARTIGQLMGEVKAAGDARARLDAALGAARRDAAAAAARHDAAAQEKEAELSKQMSIILETRAEKPVDTYLIQKKTKFCPCCGKHGVRLTDKCRLCSHAYDEDLGDLERCRNCAHLLAPKWSFCEVCGTETRRAQRLKRAKMLSSRAKIPKIAARPTTFGEVASPEVAGRAASPDVFEELHVDLGELDSLESSASMPTAPPSAEPNEEPEPTATMLPPNDSD